MSAMLAIPRLAEDEYLSLDTVDGLNGFALNIPLKLMSQPEQVRGWNLGWARCYGQGVKAWASFDDLDGEAENRYPQFSGPWEAWAEGYDSAESL